MSYGLIIELAAGFRTEAYDIDSGHPLTLPLLPDPGPFDPYDSDGSADRIRQIADRVTAWVQIPADRIGVVLPPALDPARGRDLVEALVRYGLPHAELLPPPPDPTPAGAGRAAEPRVSSPYVLDQLGTDRSDAELPTQMLPTSVPATGGRTAAGATRLAPAGDSSVWSYAPADASASSPARRRRPLVLGVLALAVVAALVVGGTVLWPRFNRPGNASTTPEVSPPAPNRSPTAGPGGLDLPRSAPLSSDQFIVPRGLNNEQRLYLASVAGPVGPRRLPTPAGHRVNGPTLSADRQTLLYLDRTNETLRTVAVDGSGDRLLTDRLSSACETLGHVTWSPTDPTLLVLQCTSRTKPDRLLVVDTQGTLIRELDGGQPRLDDPSISPDGRTVAYWASDESKGPSGGSIYTMPIDGSSAPVALTQEKAGRDADPAWSPDGTSLAFRRRISPSNVDVYVMAADGSKVRPLVTGPGLEEKPAWSPDGSRVLVISDRDATNRRRGVDLYVVSAAGGEPKPLGLTAADISTPVWTRR